MSDAIERGECTGYVVHGGAMTVGLSRRMSCLSNAVGQLHLGIGCGVRAMFFTESSQRYGSQAHTASSAEKVVGA